ncbi:MAG: hypothetical protein GX275_07505 [Clostridiales bacterium]|nr:hypothetical protein [Clostridiales bacterium]
MIKVIIENNEFANEIEYSLAHIMRGLGEEYQIINFDEYLKIYDYENDKHYKIVYLRSNTAIEKYKLVLRNSIFIKGTQAIFGKNYLKIESLPQNMLEKDSIVDFYDNAEVLCRKEINNNCIISVDFISNTFYFLTRYEECILNKDRKLLDIHERFTAKNTLMYKYGFNERPIVDEYWYYLRGLLHEMGYDLKKTNNKLKVCLTHDIDEIQKYYSIKNAIRSSASWAIKHRNIYKSFMEIQEYIKGKSNYKKDAFWTFEKLVKLEKDRGFTASYYFMTSGKANVDNRYNFQEERVKEVIQYLLKNDMEVGFHGGYDTFNNKKEFHNQLIPLVRLLDNYRFGMRQHFLRFKTPDTWRIQESEGILYDTTLGFADAIGFRAGTSIPFKPYDIYSNRVINMWEIPLIVMDTSLKNEKYCNLTPEDSMKKIIKLMEVTKKYNGFFTLLWHNSSFDTSWREWSNMYEEILNYIYENSGEGLSGKELVNKYLLKGEVK